MRSLLTTLGTVLGLASLIATVGLSRTAGSQIVDQFDELSATQVMITARSNGRGGTSAVLPWDVEQRLDRLNGVVASGAVADVVNPGPIRTVPVLDVTGEYEHVAPVLAASAGLLDAVRGHIAVGRWFDAGHVAPCRSGGRDRRRPGRRARHQPARGPARACTSASTTSR